MCLLLAFVLCQSTISLTDTVVLSFLGAVFTALCSVIAVLWNALQGSEKDKSTLSRDTINALNNNDNINKAAIERDRQIISTQEKILNALHELNK